MILSKGIRKVGNECGGSGNGVGGNGEGVQLRREKWCCFLPSGDRIQGEEGETPAVSCLDSGPLLTLPWPRVRWLFILVVTGVKGRKGREETKPW